MLTKAKLEITEATIRRLARRKKRTLAEDRDLADANLCQTTLSEASLLHVRGSLQILF